MEEAMSEVSVDGEVLQLIKQVILEEAGRLGVEVEKIILFGSRARGEARPDSDYDILVVVKGQLERMVRIELATRITSTLTHLLGVPVDVIITTGERWRKYSSIVGTIEEVAASEGIPA